MSEEYSLTRDIVYDHNERMLNIRKYYPFFKLAETSFEQYKEGKYDRLDMGYILMAVLRFFIEKNNFHEKMVTYKEYENFIEEIISRDFEYFFTTDEEKNDRKNLISFIFDKIKNDGKPFSYQYYDPESKKKKLIRVKILDTKIENDNIVYFITSDAIEFYLDTKEIKDESNITVAQVLLEKMIATKNFRGGTEVVSRINNEVSRLISRKNEILNILSYDVFEGIKAYEEFLGTGAKWFDEEQKLFVKNKQLIDQALRAGASDNRYFEAMDDIYHLETELNRAMRKHGELLSACASLQKSADEIISTAKLNRLRSAFDFRKFLSEIISKNRVNILAEFTVPLLKPAIKKNFSLISIDNLITYRTDDNEEGEKIKDENSDEIYKYEDELETERIFDNYSLFIRIIISTLKQRKEVEIEDINKELVKYCGKDAMKNSDYYSFLVHLCQKNKYSFTRIKNKPDTFLEEIIKQMVDENIIRQDEIELSFEIIFNNNKPNILIDKDGICGEISNISIRRLVQED